MGTDMNDPNVFFSLKERLERATTPKERLKLLQQIQALAEKSDNLAASLLSCKLLIAGYERMAKQCGTNKIAKPELFQNRADYYIRILKDLPGSTNANPMCLDNSDSDSESHKYNVDLKRKLPQKKCLK